MIIKFIINCSPDAKYQESIALFMCVQSRMNRVNMEPAVVLLQTGEPNNVTGSKRVFTLKAQEKTFLPKDGFHLKHQGYFWTIEM